MKCPVCRTRTKVIDSRIRTESVKRVRERANRKRDYKQIQRSSTTNDRFNRASFSALRKNGSRGRGVAFQYGYGYSVQISLYKNDFNYLVVTPSQVKKFATGLGNASKESMILPIYKRWGYEHESDNVRDAFILAQIARATKISTKLTKYQKEIVDALKKGLV